VSEARGPGRPLDRSRGDAILAATLELFDEAGWEGLTVAAVAARAKVGLSTIYRRWGSKSELVAAALASTLRPTTPCPSSGSVIPETLELIRQNLIGARAEYFPGLLAAMRADPATAAAIRTATIEPDRARLRAEVAARLGDDADPVLVELIADIGPAVLVHRALIVGEALPGDVAERLTELIDILIVALVDQPS